MYRPWLRLVAPFRCQFNLNGAKIIENRKEFNTYLQDLSADFRASKQRLFPEASQSMVIESAKMIDKNDEFNAFLKTLNTDFCTARSRWFPNVPEGVIIEALLQSYDDDAVSRYISLDRSGSLFHSPQYFSVTFDEPLYPKIETLLKDAMSKADRVCTTPLSAVLIPKRDSVDIAVYDNTIAVLTIDLETSERFADADRKKLDEWTTRFTLFFLAPFYKAYIFPALCDVNTYAANHAEERIRQPDDYHVFYDMSGSESDPSALRLLWVNRTFVYGAGDDALGAWARERLHASAPLRTQGIDVYLGSGMNVIEKDDKDTRCDLPAFWQALRLAQYYYAMLDVANKNLKRFSFASLSYGKKNRRTLIAWKRAMEAVLDAVPVIQADYKDLAIELQGFSKAVFRRLEKEWEFATLFANVQSKYQLCRLHILTLNAYIDRLDRSRMNAMLIVGMAVGFVEILICLMFYKHVIR